MKKVYFDNASTSAIDPRVIQEMLLAMADDYGNPSSSHAFGRQAKSKLELARKTIAKHLKVSAAEIVFTSGGTEGNNWVLTTAIRDLGIKRIISSKIDGLIIQYLILTEYLACYNSKLNKPLFILSLVLLYRRLMLEEY